MCLLFFLSDPTKLATFSTTRKQNKKREESPEPLMPRLDLQGTNALDLETTSFFLL